jgi:hypothetical protein
MAKALIGFFLAEFSSILNADLPRTGALVPAGRTGLRATADVAYIADNA